MTSTFPANEYGPLYYRTILKNKDDFLKANKGNFNARIDLTKNVLQEVKWLENKIFYAFKPIRNVKTSKVIYTDASLEGWKASYGNTPTGGAWPSDEKMLQIKILELKAIFLALKAFIKTKNEHVKIMFDNTTSISCINKLETSHSMNCHYLTVKIWEWAMKSNIQLTAAHIPGKQKIIANRKSRVCHVDSEWVFFPWYLYQSLNLQSFKPDIDLFVTQVNRQFNDYVAYRSDPEATFIDAFTIDWSGLKFYAFPPITIISRVLSKISQDEAEGIIVVPYWPNQVWYPVMLKMLISIPILLNSRKSHHSHQSRITQYGERWA